ncbi:lysophospholipid acyltransferase 6-like isoform X2 [Glandiceps talaboti]
MCRYRRSMLHLLLHSTIGLILTKFVNRKYMAIVVFFVTMAHLSIEHIRKELTGSASDLLHHETPMMMMTMKVTSVAFGLHDGSSMDSSKQHPKQRLLAIRRFPSILEYYSYIFNFQTFLIGPFCFFTDYIDFVEGKNLVPYKIKTKDGKEVIISREPSVMGAFFEKVTICVITGTTFVVYGSSYTAIGNISEEVLNSSHIYRAVYLALCMGLIMFKYAFGIITSDLVCNASGFGFNGYDDNGNPKWDLVTSINFVKFWRATDINDNISNWNVTVIRWLKYACYYRVPYHKDKFTILLSTVWHGFYPGYFWTLFLNMMFCVPTSKRVHSYIDEFNIKTTPGRVLYYCILWPLNTLYLNYMCIAHFLVYNPPIIQYYSSLYFCGHIFSILMLCILPAKKITRKIISSNAATLTNEVPMQPVNKMKDE